MFVYEAHNSQQADTSVDICSKEATFLISAATVRVHRLIDHEPVGALC